MNSDPQQSAENPYRPTDQPSDHKNLTPTESQSAGYWNKSLKIVGGILFVWAFVSLGCGILFRDFLDSMLPPIGGAPFGFWMAQQGSIISFLILLFVYMLLMNRLDRKYGFEDGDKQ